MGITYYGATNRTSNDKPRSHLFSGLTESELKWIQLSVRMVRVATGAFRLIRAVFRRAPLPLMRYLDGANVYVEKLTARRPSGYSAETSRGGAAAATRIFRGDEFAAAPRLRRGYSVETSSPRRRGRRGYSAETSRGRDVGIERRETRPISMIFAALE